MQFRVAAGRLALVSVAVAAAVLTAAQQRPAAAAGNEFKASPAATVPNGGVVVTGTIPSQAAQPYFVSQIYTNGDVARVRTDEAGPFMAGPQGQVTATVAVPTDAARSDVLRPYGSWQYDVVSFDFGPGCPFSPECVSYGTNVKVLPISTNEKIHLATLAPRTGETLHVTAENCYGTVLTEFARVIDGNGAYFPFTGSMSGTTFTGSADLSKGFRGKYGPQGAAHVSSPIGTRDALAAVPCSQSEGPASVAAADYLEHLSMVIDITICPTSGCTPTKAIPPAGQPPVFNVPADSTSQTVVPAAIPAEAIAAEPNFVG